MPRKTRLALISERALTDEEDRVRAAAELREAEDDAHPLVAPDDILDALRAQNADLARVASIAVDERNAAEQRAVTAENREAELREAKAKMITEFSHITALNEQNAALNAEQQQHRAAEQAAVAAGLFRQGAALLGAAVSFVAERAALLTLLGAYFLARDMLPHPDAYQLVLLGIYGSVAVAPAVWFTRRG